MPELGSTFATSAAKATAPALIRLLSNVGKRRYDAIIAKYSNVFNDHLSTVRDRVSIVKNLIYKEDPVSLLTQYVPISFIRKNSSITDREISDSLRAPTRLLLVGTGGAGKTMFMKWCTLDLINSILNHQMIPLFLELREVSSDQVGLDFENILFTATSSSKSKATFDQFLAGLEAGVFTIILDAVDEVNPEHRAKIVSSIRSLSRRYPNIPIIVSSRPDPALEAIPEFCVIKARPMELSQIIDVLEKLDYDKYVKDKLISEMRNGLYEKHKSFLSNPLLATIMLLTYDQSAEIPTKETSFYKQAFEALYQRHDATKGVYKRGHYAGLPLDQFENVFSAFCYRTYVNTKFEFSDTELIRYFRESAEYCGLPSNPDMIVRDSMESVCLIQKEGLDNTFVHRSFQEYFCALFISNYRGHDIAEVMDRAFQRSYNDKVIPMLYEINPALFEVEYALPNLTAWMSQTSRLNLRSPSGMHKFMQATFGSMTIEPATGAFHSFHIGAGKHISRLAQVYSKAAIHEHVFGKNAAITNLPTILADTSLTSAALRAMRRGVESEPERVSIEPTLSEAKWLVKTNWPKQAELIRDDLAALHKEVVSNVEGRRESIRRLFASGERS